MGVRERARIRWEDRKVKDSEANRLDKEDREIEIGSKTGSSEEKGKDEAKR